MSVCKMSQELYVYAFKSQSSLKTPDECFMDITFSMELKCTEDEITKLSITYTSLGELFETQLDENGHETFFNYLDLVYNTDTVLFENLHMKFIINVLSEMRSNTSCNLIGLMKVGCIALLGNNLNRIQLNRKFPSPFSKTFLLGMIEEQQLSFIKVHG